MTKLVYSDINLTDNHTYSLKEREISKVKFGYYVDHIYWTVPERFFDYLFDLDSHYLSGEFCNMSEFINFRKYSTVDSYEQMFIETVRNHGFTYDIYKFLSKFRFDAYDFGFHCVNPSEKEFVCGIKTTVRNQIKNGFITSDEIMVVNQWDTTNNFSKFRKGFYDAYCKLLNKNKVQFYVPLNLNAVIQEEEVEDYVDSNRSLCKKEKDSVKKFIYRTNLHMLQFTLRMEG